MSAKTIVILRTPEDSAEIAVAVEERGFVPLIEPILAIDYLDIQHDQPEDDVPLIFTSANGVRAFAKFSELRDNPVYTVGRNTADAARQIGFSRVESAFGTVDDLVDLFTGPLKTSLRTPIYVRGKDISQDLSSIFAKNDLKIDGIMGYSTNPAENLSLELLKKLDNREINAVMVFSAKGAETFANLVEQYGRTPRIKTIKALCIGASVVDFLSVLPFAEVVVADKPDRYGMIKLLDRLT